MEAAPAGCWGQGPETGKEMSIDADVDHAYPLGTP